MKKSLLLFLLLLFVSTFAQYRFNPHGLGTEDQEREKIISFHSIIDVNKNSGIIVTEKIKVYSTGNEIKRGIFRNLPLSRNLNNKKQKVRYTIISITKDGKKETYHTKKNGDNFEIYVGKKNIIIDTGSYDYEIKYETKNQIGFFDTYDEFYWNVNGNAWNFPIDTISAKVNLPTGAHIIQNSCYTGVSGSRSQDCSAKALSENSMEWRASDLYPSEGLTIAVGFDKGIMNPPPPPDFMEKYGLLIGLFTVLFILLIYFWITWKKYGVDPAKPIIYPQFNVPDNLSPASMGYIINERFKNNFLTAALVNLAIKGYIKIVESKTSGTLGMFSQTTFTLDKLKEADQSLPSEEINLMDNLFSGTNRSVKLDGKYNYKIENAVNLFRSSLSFQHNAFLNEGNNRKKLLFPFFLISVIHFSGLMISFKMYDDPTYLITGILLYIILTVAFIIFTFAVRKWFWWLFLPFLILTTVCIGGFYMLNQEVETQNFTYCYIFSATAFFALTIFQYLVKRPSEEKLKKISLIEGFKMYMGAAENEQLKFHNPPQITPQVFESLLPYAMILGVDDIWGKKFERIMKNMAMEYHNNWYSGSMTSHYALASALNSGLTRSIQTTSTQPSSNSSSSSSGSGGGGFSGGGGGGGGGGGW